MLAGTVMRLNATQSGVRLGTLNVSTTCLYILLNIYVYMHSVSWTILPHIDAFYLWIVVSNITLHSI